MRNQYWFTVAILISLLITSVIAGDKKIVIAHRGASGYLPEHTMESKALAYAMGADYIEQDLVMTKDDRVIVLHDLFLDDVTNVAELFPNRHRPDGRYYAIDFTLEEIRRLKVTERFKIKNGQRIPVFQNRFPLWKSDFRIHTFEEEIELIQGLNKSTGKEVGIYPEIKSPGLHRKEGKDISIAVLKLLKKYGYDSKEDLVYLQCFDPGELKRIRYELFPRLNMEVKLVQLLPEKGQSVSFEQVRRMKGLLARDPDLYYTLDVVKNIAAYADGIGPSMSLIVKKKSTKENLVISKLVQYAHQAGLVVHPYTFRRDDGRIRKYVDSFTDLLYLFYFYVGVDGVFTDFPDLTASFVKEMEKLK